MGAAPAGVGGGGAPPGFRDQSETALLCTCYWAISRLSGNGGTELLPLPLYIVIDLKEKVDEVSSTNSSRSSRICNKIPFPLSVSIPALPTLSCFFTMLEHFLFLHIPMLLAATSMTLGGLWTVYNGRDAILAFGLPARIANTSSAPPVMMIAGVRTSVLGLLILIFYSRAQLDVVDIIMAVTGAYAGLVDSYVVWKEASSRTAVLRLISSGLVFAWGSAGWTAAGG